MKELLKLASIASWLGMPVRTAAMQSTIALVALLTFVSANPQSCRGAALDVQAVDPAPAGSPPLLQASRAITAISGRVLSVGGAPLLGVRVSTDSQHVITGRDGLFLLQDLRPGEQVLRLDGRNAHKAEEQPGDYGYYEIKEYAIAGETRLLPYVDWLTKIDHGHDVTLSQPLSREQVVTTPAIPLLELHLPAKAVLTDVDGKLVKQIGLTKIDVHRPPFPFPLNVHVPVYFTAQPGGTVISSADGSWLGAQLVYPNYWHDAPHARGSFWRYLPDRTGWEVYGRGTVSDDGKQVRPDPTTRLYELSGAMFSNKAPPQDHKGRCGTSCGDPIDVGSGAFSESFTDLSVPDVIPITVTRTYQSDDFLGEAFGVGMNLSYDMYLSFPDAGVQGNQYGNTSLVLADGSQIAFTAINGTGGCFIGGGLGSCTTNPELISVTPGPFYNAHLTYTGTIDTSGVWTLVTKSGTVFTIGEQSPLQSVSDRFGNTVTLIRVDVNNRPSPSGNIVQINSPNGKHIFLNWNYSYNGSGQKMAFTTLASATDDAGRTVSYSYKAGTTSGTLLASVVDPDTNTTSYNWNANNQLVSIKDADGHTPFTNVYCTTSTCPGSPAPDIQGQVATQTLANGTVHTLTYASAGSGTTTTDSVNIANNTTTNPVVAVSTFDSNSLQLTYNTAVGSPVEIDTTYCYYQDASNPSNCPANSGNIPLALADVIDGLGRDTNTTYDTLSNITATTSLYGTAAKVTYSTTYSPSFSLITSTTDPLQHTWTTVRPVPMETAASVTDPLGNSTQFSYTAEGQTQSVTDPLNRVTQFGYDGGDLQSVTRAYGTALQRTTTYFTDVIGRRTRGTDALGNLTQWSYDPVYGVSGVVDPAGETTGYQFDGVGNLKQVSNANAGSSQGITQYSYDKSNRVSVRTDPDKNADKVSVYDGYDNVVKATDRDGNLISNTYDALGRIVTAQYTNSVTAAVTLDTYTWDKGNRLTEIVETTNGSTSSVINRAYDQLDRLACETNYGGSITPSSCPTSNTAYNSIAYTYDAASRIHTKTITGQAQIVYAFDNANRLKTITQGSSKTSFTYYGDNRRHTITYPAGANGVPVIGTYTWDGAAQLSSIVYSNVSGCGGCDLTYAYDLNGRVTARDGALFQAVLSAQAFTALYDPADRISSWTSAGATTMPIWDNNGNSVCNNGSGTWSTRSDTWSCSGQTLTWDSRNRLLSALPNAADSNYSYDGIGRRLTKSGSSGGAVYLYDGLNVAQEEAQGGGSATANVVNGLELDERFSRTEISGTTQTNLVYLTDALGSTVALVNNGAAQTFYGYDPFGKATGPIGTQDAQPYQFTGREADLTGFQFDRSRYYNSTWGRFLSEDPIGLVGGINRYAYVGDDPVNLTDPNGNCPICLAIALVELAEEAAAVVEAGEAAEAAAEAGEAAEEAGSARNAVDAARNAADAAQNVADAANNASGSQSCSQSNPMQGRYDAAQQNYPNKQGYQDHHITPKYLGGNPNGPTSRIPSAYHQEITNAFRNAYPYGQAQPSSSQLQEIMNQVYSQYPLPP